MIQSGLISQWKENTKKVNEENNWQLEKQKLISLITSIE
jgi:hypothetical protein